MQADVIRSHPIRPKWTSSADDASFFVTAEGAALSAALNLWEMHSSIGEMKGQKDTLTDFSSITSDFNCAYLKTVLQIFHQHVAVASREEQILLHFMTQDI